MFSTSVPSSVTILPSPRESDASELHKNAALSSRFDVDSGQERVKRFLTTQPSEHHIHQPTPSSASFNISRPSPLLQTRSINEMSDSSPYPVSQSAINYLDGHQTRSVDGLFAPSSSSLAAPVPIHFHGEAPPRNFSSPLSRNRPSLEQVMARSSSVLKQRPTISDLSSPPPSRPEGNASRKQEDPKSESRVDNEVEKASDADQQAQEQRSFAQFNRPNPEGEDNGGDEELTPPPLMDYQFSDTSSEPETEPQSFEVDDESDKGGMLDNLLNGSVLAREEEQRRWRSRRDSSASALLSLHQGSPSLDQHEFDQPAPHPQSPSRLCSRPADNSSSSSGSNHALTASSQFISHRYPRPSVYPEYQRGLPATPLDGRYLPNSKLDMIERTLSDPFIPSPHVPAAPFFASPLPSVPPAYRAPAELTRHQFTHRRELSRTEPECYWHSSPSNPSTAGPLSIHSASTSPKEDREAVIRSSSEVEEGLLSPEQSSREESTSLPAHIEGSDTSSTPREASVVPNLADVPSNAWESPSFVLPSGMGSLIQAGLLAAEREGTTENPKPPSSQWAEDDDGQGQRQRILQDELDDLEDEPATEEELNSQKGKDRFQPVSENKKSKKKKSIMITSTSNFNNNNNNISINNTHPPTDTEIVVDMSHIQECDLPPQGVPSDPRPLDKPSYSYAAMIGQSILAHPRQRLSLAEIYTWISTAYPFYKKGDPGWMNSIRHNLSLNKCFIKVEREKGGPQGKGMLWAIQPGTEPQFEGGGFRKKTLPPSGKSSKGKAGSPAGPPAKGPKSKRGLPEPEVFYEQDPGLMGPPRPPMFAPVPPGKKARLEFQNGWPTHPTSSRAHEVFVSSPSTSSPALGFGQSHESNMGGYSDHSNGLYPPHRSRSAMKEKLSEGHDQDLDDFTTPRRAVSRGPSGNSSLGESNEPIGSSGQPILPPSALSGLPHLTPSISSPVSSSPGPATLPRPSLIQAHRALLKSSQRDPENVTVVEGEESTPLRIMIPAQGDLEGEGLQPGFEFDQVRLTPQDQSHPSHYQSQHHHHQHQHEHQAHHQHQQLQSHPPPSPSPHFATSTSINHSVYSPISSLRATANDDESQEPSVWTTSMMHNPLHSSIHHNPLPAFAHMSPLQSRKASAAGGGGSGHRRGLSATGELIAHAMNPPSSSAYKTPGMQPMMSSPRRPLSKPYSFPYNHGSLSPASARKVPPPFSSTPKSASILTSSANPSNIRTPASQTTYGLTSQSPAGAAMLQHRAEMGILGFGLGFGDCGNYGDFQPGTPRLEDPYDSSRAVEDELIHLNARNTGSPASHWGGMGTPRMGLGIGGGWSFSPGIGFGDRLRNSSN